jgi:hypothetical protein
MKQNKVITEGLNFNKCKSRVETIISALGQKQFPYLRSFFPMPHYSAERGAKIVLLADKLKPAGLVRECYQVHFTDFQEI